MKGLRTDPPVTTLLPPLAVLPPTKNPIPDGNVYSMGCAGPTPPRRIRHC